MAVCLRKLLFNFNSLKVLNCDRVYCVSNTSFLCSKQKVIPALRFSSVSRSAEPSRLFEDPNKFNDEPSTDLMQQVVKEDLLGECNEDVSMYTPYASPSFNLAAYVNKSPTLQELVKLGVNLHKLENMKGGVAEAILKLDFEKDIKKYIMFLNDLQVPPDEFGSILSKCPRLLFQDLENLQIRVNYLESKMFCPSDVVRIITRNPAWFTWKTQDIDYRLGFFQKEFKLRGNEVRQLAVKNPVLITHKLDSIKLNIFGVREEMGFTPEESKQLLLAKPKIYTIDKESLVSRFEYLHRTMQLSHAALCAQPDGLLHRRRRLEARHGFLRGLGRAQYDPLRPGYVSLRALLSGSDSEFASLVAKASIQTYNKYLKSL